MNLITKAATASALVAATLTLSGCLGLAVTGAAVGTMALTDRRTVGAQTEDQAIELKAANRLRSALPNAAEGISITSFNRKVLLTGQVPDETVKRQAESIVAQVDNVRSVHNELMIGSNVGLRTTTSDAALTARVKAQFVESKQLQANALKVVTEAGSVYLMGLVTQREGQLAADLASRVSGVKRVVTVFEYISDAERERIQRNQDVGPQRPQSEGK